LVKNQGACWLLRRAPHSSDSRLPCASKCLECGGCGTGWRSIGVAGVERPGVWEAPAFVGRAKAGFGEAPCNGLEDVLGGSEPAVERSAYEFGGCPRSPPDLRKGRSFRRVSRLRFVKHVQEYCHAHACQQMNSRLQ
jgi:hypothetical protein